RAESGTAVEPADLLVGAKEGFLNQVLGIIFIGSHTVGETEQCVAVAFHQDTKGVLIPLPGLVGSGRIGPFHPAVLRLGTHSAVRWKAANCSYSCGYWTQSDSRSLSAR